MRISAILAFLFLYACDAPDGIIEQLPLAEEEHARVAANDCSIEEWGWTTAYALSEPPIPPQKSFSYELEPTPDEAIEPQHLNGQTWDMTDRVKLSEACVRSSFERQGVYSDISPPGLVLTIVE
ncbi:hypothetical protein [Parasphingorhabdus sp.]|uniref:hypothetical protein n=1 Tax=Parasphingorhabdus sp. TaxID=2709688 RepID=UPI0032667151